MLEFVHDAAAVGAASSTKHRIEGDSTKDVVTQLDAVGHKPLSMIVPCHRVVGKDGKLTGYAGELDRKTIPAGTGGTSRGEGCETVLSFGLTFLAPGASTG